MKKIYLTSLMILLLGIGHMASTTEIESANCKCPDFIW